MYEMLPFLVDPINQEIHLWCTEHQVCLADLVNCLLGVQLEQLHLLDVAEIRLKVLLLEGVELVVKP